MPITGLAEVFTGKLFPVKAQPRGRTMTTNKLRMAVAASTATAAMGTLLLAAPPAKALPPGCVGQPWGFLGSQTRQICDGPLAADGSWLRRRIIGRPSYYRNATSQCSSYTYSSSCTYYPAGWVDEVITEDNTYPVTPETVLPDEPGWIAH